MDTPPPPPPSHPSETAAKQYATGDAVSKTGLKLLGVGCSLMGVGILIPLLIVCGIVAWAVVSSLLTSDDQGVKTGRDAPHKHVQSAGPRQAPKTEPDTILTGFVTVYVGDTMVSDLDELVVGLYNGSVSENFALRCVCMPGAQNGEAVKSLGGVTIYRFRGGRSGELYEFGVMHNEGNRDPLLSGPVRFSARESFTTAGGMVKSVPVFAVEKAAVNLPKKSAD